MRSSFDQSHSDGFIHIVQPSGFVFGERSIDEVWGLIGKACEMHDCKKVLVEGREFHRDLDTAGAFDSGLAASRIATGLRVALCFPDHEPDEVSEFFLTVARNRGTQIEFFQEKKAATDWLGVDPEA